jgi:hypothetical protein
VDFGKGRNESLSSGTLYSLKINGYLQSHHSLKMAFSNLDVAAIDIGSEKERKNLERRVSWRKRLRYITCIHFLPCTFPLCFSLNN